MAPKTSGTYKCCLIWQSLCRCHWLKETERKRLSWIIEVGSKSSHKDLYETATERDVTQTEEERAMWPQGQTQVTQPQAKNDGNHQKMDEARDGFPLKPQKEPGPAIILISAQWHQFWTSHLQNCYRLHVCCLKRQVCGKVISQLHESYISIFQNSEHLRIWRAARCLIPSQCFSSASIASAFTTAPTWGAAPAASAGPIYILFILSISTNILSHVPAPLMFQLPQILLFWNVFNKYLLIKSIKNCILSVRRRKITGNISNHINLNLTWK